MIPLPCPFCGSTNITAQRGSTFRWWYAGCCECGAQAGEVRRQTLGDGTNEEWDAKAAADAIKEWNTRAPVALAPQPVESDPGLTPGPGYETDAAGTYDGR